MIEGLTYKGKWWRPEDPNRKISGTVYFTPYEGTELKLDGIIASPNKAVGNDEFDLIFGEVYGNKTITLMDCFATNATFASGGMSSSVYFANKMFIGGPHLQSITPKFIASSSIFQHLSIWIGGSWYDFDEVQDRLKILSNDSFDILVSDEINISLKNQNKKNFSIDKILIENELNLKIKFNIPRSVETFQKYIYSFQHFITLLSQNSIVEQTTKYFINKGKFPEYKLFQPKTADIFSTNIDLFFFKFSDIKNNLQKLFETWLKMEIEQKELIDLYFTPIYNKGLNLVYKFLHLAQAIEVYYSSKWDNKYLDDDDFMKNYYHKLLNNFKDIISGDFLESAKQKLKYFHYHSFRKSLKEIINKAKDNLSINIGFENSFIEDVVNSRNYFVHRDNNLVRMAKHNHELLDLSDKLYFLLTVNLMIDLGLDIELIKAKSKSYRYFSEYFNKD